jgi:integrase
MARKTAGKRRPTRRKLTEMTLQRESAGKRRKLIWDTIQRGLALAIEPTGRRSWKFVYRWPPGAKESRPVWLTWSGLGLAAAREKAQAQWKLILEGIDPRTAPKASLQNALTFDELHKRYVAEWSRKSNRAWQDMERLVAKHLVSEFGSMPAAHVTRADFNAAISKLREAGKDQLANRVLSHGAAVYRWAIKKLVLDLPANPAHGLERVKGEKKKRWLAESELKDFWKESFNHGAAGAALRAMALTGQRGNEIRRYDPGHVEDSRWWNIPASIMKAKTDHRVYLTDDALEALGAMTWGDIESVERRETDMQDAATAIWQKLEQPKWTPHTLRHTVNSHLARMKVHKEIRQRILGHSEGDDVESGYNHHTYDSDKRLVMRRWEAELRRIVAGKPAKGEVVKMPTGGAGERAA